MRCRRRANSENGGFPLRSTGIGSKGIAFGGPQAVLRQQVLMVEIDRRVPGPARGVVVHDLEVVADGSGLNAGHLTGHERD